MSSYSILSFGDSPACSYLPWRLSTLKRHRIVTVESSCVNIEDNSILWGSTKYGEGGYNPELIIHRLKDLSSVKQKFPSFDFILLGGDTKEEFHNYAKEAAAFINESTAILVDSSTCVGLETELQTSLPGVPTFAIVCDTEIRVLKESEQARYFHRGRSNTTVIGSTQDNNAFVSNCLKGDGQLGQKLSSISEELKSCEIHPCYLIPNGINPTINSFAWKKIIPFVCFEVISLLYSKVDMANRMSSCIVKGAFNDLLTLSRKTGALDLPDPKDAAKAERFFTMSIREHNQKFPCNYIRPNPRTNNSPIVDDLEFESDSSVCVYNFARMSKTYISISLDQLLVLGEKHSLRLPYIETLACFYYQIENLRNERIFNWVTRVPFRSGPSPLNQQSHQIQHPHKKLQQMEQQLQLQLQQQMLQQMQQQLQQQQQPQQLQQPSSNYPYQVYAQNDQNANNNSNNNNNNNANGGGGVFVAIAPPPMPPGFQLLTGPPLLATTAPALIGVHPRFGFKQRMLAHQQKEKYQKNNFPENTQIPLIPPDPNDISKKDFVSFTSLKNSLYRNVSNDSSVSGEELHRAQSSVIGHSNVKRILDTNFAFSEFHDLSRMSLGVDFFAVDKRMVTVPVPDPSPVPIEDESTPKNASTTLPPANSFTS